jgi:hypothetical protein
MLHIIFWGFVVFGIGYVIGWHTHTEDTPSKGSVGCVMSTRISQNGRKG